MARKEYSYRAAVLMTLVTFGLAFGTFNLPEYWGEDIITIFFVLTVISAIRTVHVAGHARSG